MSSILFAIFFIKEIKSHKFHMKLIDNQLCFNDYMALIFDKMLNYSIQNN